MGSARHDRGLPQAAAAGTRGPRRKHQRGRNVGRDRTRRASGRSNRGVSGRGAQSSPHRVRGIRERARRMAGIQRWYDPTKTAKSSISSCRSGIHHDKAVREDPSLARLREPKRDRAERSTMAIGPTRPVHGAAGANRSALADTWRSAFSPDKLAGDGARLARRCYILACDVRDGDIGGRPALLGAAGVAEKIDCDQLPPSKRSIGFAPRAANRSTSLS